MTKENKDIFFKDLAARLPYGVIGLYSWKGNEPYDRELTGMLYDELVSAQYSAYEDTTFLPYLRRMSSMTKEEMDEYAEISSKIGFPYKQFPKLTDWLNQHHFDYRDLISLGLTTDAPDHLYKAKT